MKKKIILLTVVVIALYGLTSFLNQFFHERAIAMKCWNNGINPVTMPEKHDECVKSITFADYFMENPNSNLEPPTKDSIVNYGNMTYSP